MSDYILTFTGVKFNPFEPKESDINIYDIAHSLSLLTRANGHFKHFYSVAQHSINCYQEALGRGFSRTLQLACLLHDSSESYISDLTRPVKSRLEYYLIVEEKLQKMIYKRFGLENLSCEDIAKVKCIDDTVLHYEFLEFKGVPIFDNIDLNNADYNLDFRDMSEVEKEFLNIFDTLYKEGL